MRDAETSTIPESFWRSLHHLNRYRYFLAAFFLLIPLYGDRPLLGQEEPTLFMAAAMAYGVAAGLLGLTLHWRWGGFARQLDMQVAADVFFLTVLMRLSGGNESGIGLLLIIPMAASGLHPQRRMTLFLAAVAAVAVLLEQSAHSLWWQGGTAGFLRAGVLATGFFAISAFSHFMARSAASATRLADEKTAEADSLARINARVVQELPYGVLVVDGNGGVLQHNAKAEDLLACRVFDNAHLMHCSPPIDEAWQQWRSGGDNPQTPVAAGRDGRRLRMRFSEFEPTRAAGVVILLEDMTELERVAQNMKLAALGRLTANLAHEIRNPLSAIQQAAGLLAEEPSTPTMERLARIVEDNGRRLDGLVEDVLALNRRDRVTAEEIGLAEFLREFVAQFQQTERMPQEVIHLSVPEQLHIRFDRLHLHQILWNLMRNAWRYCTRRPDSISLRALASDKQVHIEVFNDGEPVSPEMQARLFEPFHTTDKRGTGLGLYIARELADANGGSLCYVNRTGGALFQVIAPAARSEGGTLPE